MALEDALTFPANPGAGANNLPSAGDVSFRSDFSTMDTVDPA